MLRTRILAAFTATLLALGMAAGGASPATAAPPQEDKKVWVCKYSGTPGVNEQYKDGKNPIEVSVTTIANNSGFDPVTGTGYFADGQARSFSLGYSATFDVPPTIEDCPRPVLPVPGYDVTDQTCLAGGSITLDQSVYITYVVTNSSGAVIPNNQLTNLAPGTYTVTPTAVPPAILDVEFYDPVAVILAVDPALCADLATASIAFTAATCLTAEQLNTGGFAVDNASLTSSVVDGGTYTVLFTADAGSLFAAGAGVSADRTTLTFTGTLDGVDLSQCAAATASIAFIAPTCTVGELLNEAGYTVNGATLTSSEVVAGVYTVVFTVIPGSLFAAGEGVSENRTTLTYTGSLDPPDLTLCPVASASIAFTDPTCNDGQQLNAAEFDATNATLTSSEVVGSEYTVVFTAEGDALFASGPGVSENRTTLTFTGTLDPNDERLCLVVTASFTLPPATCEVGEDWANPIIVADAGVLPGAPVFDEVNGTVTIEFLATGATVFVTMVDGEPTFSKTLTVTLDVADRDPSLCLEPTFVIPIIDPTCELSASLDVDNIDAQNATFVVINDGSESGTYEIEFTAAEGYRFADDQKTITVTGELAVRDPLQCLEPTILVPVIDPTCEAGAILDVDGITDGTENATFEVVDDGSVSGTYEIEFTADEGYRFADDQLTLTVTGELADRDPLLCLAATASVPLTDPTCLLGASVDLDGIEGVNATFEVIDDGSTDGTYEVLFTANDGYRFDGDLKQITVAGELADKDERLCLVVTASFTLPPATCEVGEDWANPIIVADAGVLPGAPVFDEVNGTVTIEFLATGATVFVTMVDGEPTFSKTLTVTLDVADRDPSLCLEPTFEIPIIDPTCELSASLDVDNIDAQNATFVVINDGSESGTYEIEFTAAEGYRFADDQKTITVTGELAGRDASLCLEPTFEIPVIDPTCELSASLDVENITAENATFVVVDDGAVSGTYEIEFTAAEGYRFADDQQTITVTEELAGRDASLCLEPTFDIPVIDPTCEVGASLDVDNITAENATFEVIDDGSESGTYEIEFTAAEGYRFADDQQTLTVSGELADRDPEQCLEATGSVPLIDPTCELGASVNLDGITGVNATFEVIDDGSTDGSYEVVFTADDGYRFAGDRQTATVTGVLADRDPSLCLEPTFEIPVIDPTCELSASLDVENIDAQNATFVVIDDGSETGTYEIKFTAADGYRFDGDLTTISVTGELAERDPSLCEAALAGVPVIDPTCELNASIDLENIVADNATFEVIDDGSVSGTYEVEFTALDGYRFAGDAKTVTLSEDLAERDPSLCLEPTYVIPVIDPTCEEGASLNLEGIDAENATFVVIDDGSETGTYEIEFTAAEGYRFADDQQTLTVFGELAGPNEELCLEAIAAIAVTDADCFFDSTLDEDGFTADNSTYEITLYNTETREYEVVFTANSGYRFDTALEGVSDDGKTRTVSGTLDAADPTGDGCVLPITDATIAFVDATCLEPQGLDVEGFGFDSELAELESVTYDGLDYTVVFVTIGEDTQFFQTDEPVEGRSVSEDGTVLTFTGTLAEPDLELCPEVVVPPVVVVNDCLEQSYTLTAVEGVTYSVSVNGSLPTAVSFEEGEDTLTFTADPFDEIVVTATADEGYVLAEGYEPFEYTFAFDEECLPTAPVTSASVTSTQPDCLGNPGSYTLTNGLGVIWTVDGVVVAGNTTYTATAGTTPTIQASLAGESPEYPLGFGWDSQNPRTLWNLSFAAATCDLPTLALTGASNALGGLGIIAVLIMMAGTGLVVARRREAVRIQG